MFILDTNVVSELRKSKSGKSNVHVLDWAAQVDDASLFLSSITILELELGTLLMERRDPIQGANLRAWLEGQVLPAFATRVLPIDIAVSRRCASLHIPNPRSYRDSLIAATALVNGMTVVTRNVSDFAGTGVNLVNPWLP